MVFNNFKCPSCKVISAAGDWNNTTRAFCVLKKLNNLLKTFKNIQHSRKEARSYICPRCGVANNSRDIHPVQASDIRGGNR